MDKLSVTAPFSLGDRATPGWVIDIGRRDYGSVLRWQRSLVPLRKRGMLRDTLILVEHEPVITLGKQADRENLLMNGTEIPKFEIERGGDITYHGPGQLVCYQIFDLTRRGRDLHTFIRTLEQGIIDALAEFEVIGKRVEGLTGVWVDTDTGERKIASVGVAAKQWISFHGVAVNISTELDQFSAINPCGLKAEQMISLEKVLGRPIKIAEFAPKLVKAYGKCFEIAFDEITIDVIAEDIESETAGGHV